MENKKKPKKTPGLHKWWSEMNDDRAPPFKRLRLQLYTVLMGVYENIISTRGGEIIAAAAAWRRVK